MKYSAVYVYKKTNDKGRELRYSLRSLHNVTNWNGQVFICGDREDWLNDTVEYIEARKSAHKYTDILRKLHAIVESECTPDDFIFFNDDFFVTEPTEVTPLYDGELAKIISKNSWQTMKSNTFEFLAEQGYGVHNYSIHVPIVYNKQNLSEIVQLCLKNKTQMSYRSLYGNIFNIGGKQYKDRKTQTSKLLNGNFLSTRIYTPELDKLFPDKSKFEV